MNDQLIRELIKELRRMRTNLQEDISLAADFNPGRPFQLYVGVEGVVKGKDENGKAINRNFTTGYHPIVMSSVSSTANGTTATSLAALYFAE